MQNSKSEWQDGGQEMSTVIPFIIEFVSGWTIWQVWRL